MKLDEKTSRMIESVNLLHKYNVFHTISDKYIFVFLLNTTIVRHIYADIKTQAEYHILQLHIIF